MKKNLESTGGYRKAIGLDMLSDEDIGRLVSSVLKMGYTPRDFRINYYSDSAEMVVLNRDLHKDMQRFRKTTYKKNKKKEIA